jgi:RNA polymerase sigma factor (sigma-70 family)
MSRFSELMSGVAAGSEDAMWELAETYTPYIVRAVRASLPKVVRTRMDSQDVAQIIWASILLGNTDLTRLKTPQQFIAFLAQAARNKVADATRHYCRTQKRDLSRERRLDEFGQRPKNALRDNRAEDSALASRAPTPSQLVSVRERWDQALAKASERDRQIYHLKLKNYTFEEIGHELRIHARTARRAIEQLIESFAK